MAVMSIERNPEALSLVEKFRGRLGMPNLQFELRQRGDAVAIVFLIGNPSDRHFRVLREVLATLPMDSLLRDRVTLKKHNSKPWLQSEEARLLQRVLSDVLTVDQNSFVDDFFERYVESVTGAEQQIASVGNHIVYGRRGSGKSTLLLYAMRKLQIAGLTHAWVSVQTYEHRSDLGVIADVVVEILRQVGDRDESLRPRCEQEIRALDRLRGSKRLTIDQLRLRAPEIKRLLADLTSSRGQFTIFLDDLHLVAPSVQPALLSFLYSFSRGNRVSLKVSAIEHFTKVWDSETRVGLETPNDAQILPLDHNLTSLERAHEHIRLILDKHATYCGLPSIMSLAGADAITRLVWVAAGVPRDALNTFQRAMASSMTKRARAVTVTSINIAAGESLDDKKTFMPRDTSNQEGGVRLLLEEVRDFCVEKKRTNAFLVPIALGDHRYQEILRLVDLRMLHTLNKGLTPDAAGERFIALLLDYGFYIRIRAARNMKLFQATLRSPAYDKLRRLPRFPLLAAAAEPGRSHRNMRTKA